MPAFAEYTAHPVFDELRKSLDEVETQLESATDESSVSVRRAQTGSTGSSERTYRIDAGTSSCRVRVSVFPVCENLYAMYVDVEDGATARFTYPMSRERVGEVSDHSFRQEFVDFLVDEISSRLAPSVSNESADIDSTSNVSRIRLDREGTITELSTHAQETLVSGSRDIRGRSIFSLIHQKNLRQVMRDLAGMVAEGTKSAEWLLRIRTADDRWRWYRVVTQNKLRTDDTILLRLHPVGSAASEA